jgi:integrase
MSVTIREYKNGGWEIDIRTRDAKGRKIRVRMKSPVTGKAAAARWGEERERELALGSGKVVAAVPTLEQFAPRFMEYVRANRYKPSGIYSKHKILQRDLLPLLGKRRLDEITDAEVLQLKEKFSGLSASTVNCTLAVLKKLLAVAVELGVIETVRCRAKLLRVEPHRPTFYEAEEAERLMRGAERVGPKALAMLLLGEDAGLRRSEMIGLAREDVDLVRSRVNVSRSVWSGIESSTKSGKARSIPMTARLARSLSELLRLPIPPARPIHGAKRSAIREWLAPQGNEPTRARLLLTDRGLPVSGNILAGWMRAVQREAGLPISGKLHILRHTFCTLLADEGNSVKVIQKMAGHAKLETTMAYVHLVPGAEERAIRSLEKPVDPAPDPQGRKEPPH